MCRDNHPTRHSLASSAQSRTVHCTSIGAARARRDFDRPLHDAASNNKSGAASELLESGAAIIILRQYTDSVRETLQMAGAEAV